MRNFEERKKLLDKSTLFYLVATNADGYYSYVNEKFATNFRGASSDFIGQAFYTSIHPNDIKKCTAMHTKCFENPYRTFTVTIRNQTTKGNYIYTQWECKAIFDDDGNYSGIYCVGFNISKYVANENQLKEARKENIDKRAIIEEIIFQHSHLIRTPLTNIMGLTAAFLDEQFLKTDSISTCAMILESTKQLDDIIKNIVKTSRNQFSQKTQ
jgi:K+-sensing histidine kinase KdpD